jgi:hypothetical protein
MLKFVRVRPTHGKDGRMLPQSNRYDPTEGPSIWRRIHECLQAEKS